MILVYQMLKVASRSWVEAARPATENIAPPLHVHFINPETRAMLVALRDMQGQQQTIANLFMLRDMLRSGAAARAAIDQARARGEPIRVISGMRDPVARSLSLVHFFGDFYGDTSRPLDRKSGGDATDTTRAIHEFWQLALSHTEPHDTFARLLTFLIGAHRTWFTDELQTILGITLGQGAFTPTTGAQVLAAGDVQLLLYRTEDLAPDAPGHAALRTKAAEFLEIPSLSLPQVNTSATRRSHARYLEASKTLSLPTEMLDAIYSDPIMHRFYTPNEITTFRHHWQTCR